MEIIKKFGRDFTNYIFSSINFTNIFVIIFVFFLIIIFPMLSRTMFSVSVLITAVIIVLGNYFSKKTFIKSQLEGLLETVKKLNNKTLEIHGLKLNAIHDEDTVKELSHRIAKFSITLHNLINHLKLISTNINLTSNQIDEQLISYIKDIRSQISNTDITFMSASEIQQFITEITESINTLTNISQKNTEFLSEIVDQNSNINIKMEALSAYVTDTEDAMQNIIAHTERVTEFTESLSSLTVETAASIMQMDATVSEVENQSKISEQLSREVMEEATQGLSQTTLSSRTIKNVSNTFKLINEKINNLKEKSRQIGDITKTINKLSDQTSLLALNATISSSSSYSSDSNFAVISEKIRELANTSSIAMREIANITDSLQGLIEDSYDLMKKGARIVQEGVEQTKLTTDNFKSIAEKIKGVNDSVVIMSNATSEHVEGSSQIAIATQEISRMSEEIADLMFKEKEIVNYVNTKTNYVGELSGDMKELISSQNKRTGSLLNHMKEMGEKTRRIFSMSEDLAINNKKILSSIKKIKVISDNNYKNSSLLYKTSISLKKYSTYLNSEFTEFRTIAKYYGGTLRLSGYGVNNKPLDPIHAFRIDEAQILSLMFSGLVKYDRLFNIVPDIAKEWSISQDGLSYTFKLRQNIIFHNGQKLTASDVEATFKRLVDSAFKSPAAGTYFIIQGAEDFNKGRESGISGIEVLDDYTIRFNLNKPLVFFIDLLALTNAYILPQTEYIKKEKKMFSIIGTGPFELAEYEVDDHINVKKYADYHIEGKPYVDRVTIELKNNVNMFKEFKEGKLDIVPLNDADDIAVVEKDGQILESLVTAVQFSTNFLAINCKKYPFDNVHFRKALSFAIDRVEICQKFPLKLAEPAYSIIPPGMPGYSELTGLTDYDPEKAKWLLENYNYDFKEPVEITFAQHGKEIPPDIQVIYENFKVLDLNVVLNGLHEHWAYVKEKKHSMFRVAWVADYPDPDNFMYSLFNSNYGDPFETCFRNKDMEELTEKARFMLDPRERLLVYEELEKIQARFSPVIPLYHKKDALLKNIYLSDVVVKSFSPAVDIDDISFNTIY